MMAKDPLLAIQTTLKADTTVTGIVSTRIYRDLLPDSPVFPAITLTEISDISDDDSNTSTQAHVRIQATAWSQGVASGEASALSKVIRKSLHRVMNTSLTSGTDPVDVISCVDAGARSDANTDVKPFIWMVHRDFLIEYSH